MSIIDTFDENGVGIITPSQTEKPIAGFPETVIAVFSAKYHQLVLQTMETSEISALMAGGLRIPISKVNYKGVSLGMYHSLIGGPVSAAFLEEVFAKGAKRVLFFGSCGSLDREITSGRLIVPTAAYRDEGTSYHYMKASDFIEIDTAKELAAVFDQFGVSYVKTKTWTTDSFYRETERNVQLRKQAGCAVVEMECASVMAVGKFRKKPVYQFLYAADCIDHHTWDKRILGNMPDGLREQILRIALETAIRL